MRFLAVFGAVIAVLSFSNVANAASISNHAQLGCSAFTLAHVTQVDCTKSYIDVSASEEAFGKTGWTMVDLGFNLGAGTWDIAGFGDYEHVMVALEGGGSYIAGLLDTSFLTGTWSGPDADLTAKLYAVEKMADVPLPASGLMLLTALGLVGLARRRRRA